MKPTNPILAAILNLLIPGLGCAYFGKWMYAIIFFFWVPLAYWTSPFLAGFATVFISDASIKQVVSIVILLLLVFRIIYEQVSVPYKLAKEINQRIEE